MKNRNVPEVIQTSAMDCGPAALAAVLNGFGQSVSYPRLREACQTEVDGTSIDTLEVLANRFGLDAEQVILPSDYVIDASAGHLPCIAVVTLPNGLTHFVVLWRQQWGFVQVMDPARGRSWWRRQRVIESLYEHSMAVPAADWLEYARSEEFQSALIGALDDLTIDARSARELLEEAFRSGHWQPVADLEAAIRMARALRDTGARIAGSDAVALLNALVQSPDLIPDRHRRVQAADDDEVVLTGAVLVRITGRSEAEPTTDSLVTRARHTQVPISRRIRQLCQEFQMDRLAAGLVGVSLLVGVITFVEALVFRYLIGAQLPAELPLLATVAFVVVTPLFAAMALEAGGMHMSQAFGRQLDTRLRAQLLEKLPRMPDAYFSSRLVSDLAERGHAMTQVREIPELLRQTVIAVSRILLLLVGLIWLLPQHGWLVVAGGLVALLAPYAIYPMLAERDLRARTHLGALSRFYLDGLRGAEAIWAHGAARSMRREQESLLVKWVQAVTGVVRPTVLFEFGQVAVLAGVSVYLVFEALQTSLSLGSMLLFAYWALTLPILSRQLTEALRQFPLAFNVTWRVLDLLDAPEEEIGDTPSTDSVSGGAVGLEFRGATVTRADLKLLDELTVRIEPGEHVAIVGASGSGKSTFLGTILGWHPLDAGELLVDGVPATADVTARLRERSVLIDPDLYLWNRTLFENIVYGCAHVDPAELELALSSSEVVDDLPKMEVGLATHVGENGSRLSGGEGQRVRIARGLLRADSGLVLLDEPFIGMDSGQRARTCSALLRRWPDATLLFVSHNVRETLKFPRVLVFGEGGIVEDGAPAALRAAAGSVYGEMIEQEDALRQQLVDNPGWVHRRLQEGRIT